MKQYITPTLVILLGFAAMHALSQGDLTAPAGAPAPTMKTLNQIWTKLERLEDPRIDLLNAPSSHVFTTDPEFMLKIIKSGSYYLSDNLTVGAIDIGFPSPALKAGGILIDASNVTVDLNGFAIRTNPAKGEITGGDGDAIKVDSGEDFVTIKNGSIRGKTVVTITGGIGGTSTWSVSAAGFEYGIRAQTSVCSVEAVTVAGCRKRGMSLGAGTVSRCIAAQNGEEGIFSAGGVFDCQAYENGESGISADLARSSLARANGFSGIHALLASQCWAGYNGIDGIFVNGGVIALCSADFNNRADAGGIDIGQSGTVRTGNGPS